MYFKKLSLLTNFLTEWCANCSILSSNLSQYALFDTQVSWALVFITKIQFKEIQILKYFNFNLAYVRIRIHHMYIVNFLCRYPTKL